ncbi:MAG: glycosyltransferase [Actinobacteria bacterium]|nr:glycosyltransferase [Actinomycetota bacterium]
MNKIVFVNATAAIEGGALIILKQFLEGIPEYSKKDKLYYLFCSSAEVKTYERENIKIINNIRENNWLNRIRWDLYGLKKWSKRKGIKADLIISFQNTGVFYYDNIKQLIYLHQSIPFSETINWNFFNKDERVLWFYKNIYKKLIRLTLKSNSYIVVQTEWMKNAVMEQFNWNSKKISVIKPNIKNIAVEKISKINFNNNEFHLFYPANSAVYKNHELIINAIKYIKDNKPEIYSNIILHFTLEGTLNNSRSVLLVNLIKDLQVDEQIKYEGKMPYEKVLSFYKSCDLMLFPSYIETFGLPLVEAANFGMPILAAEMDYAREVMGDYEGVKFLDHKDSKLWAENIIDLYNKRIKYTPYNIHYETSWKDFFELIEKLIA